MMDVVRCKDCKYYHIAWDKAKPTHYYGDYWCEWVDTNEDDYCSLGEPRDDSKRQIDSIDR